MNLKIGIIDYSLCNLYSIERALKYVGYEVSFIKHPEDIFNMDGCVLPGVGSFESGMHNLIKAGLDQAIVEYTKIGKPFLGICLGMQLLFDQSYEFGLHEGLHLVEGKVEKIKVSSGLVLPHVGWNSCSLVNYNTHKMFSHLTEEVEFYFTHSYTCNVENKNNIMATYNYGSVLNAVVAKDNIFGCQFHPELSSYAGLKILKNFINES